MAGQNPVICSGVKNCKFFVMLREFVDEKLHALIHRTCVNLLHENRTAKHKMLSDARLSYSRNAPDNIP